MLPAKRARNVSRVALPKRRRLANVAVVLYVQSLRRLTRRVAITSPRLTSTVTRPLQPADRATPLGSVSRPLMRKLNGARRSRAGVTAALSLPLPRAGAATGGGGGGTAAAAGGGGGGGGGVTTGAGRSRSTYSPELTSLATMSRRR